MKRIVSLLLAATVTLMLVGCGAKKDIKKIGVLQLVQHGALDSAYAGFVEGLQEAGYVDGENIEIDYQNAQGDISNTNTIAATLVNDKSDLILAIATPAAQAVANATQDIPVLITAVTDPQAAALVASNEVPGGNITGTSDLTPVKEQIELLKKVVPDAKTIGIIYNSGESNSHIQAAMAVEAAEALGMVAKEFTASETNQIQQVVQTAVSQVDALYVPTDSMMTASMPIIATIALENQIPLIGAEKSAVENGALITYGIDYHQLGILTARQAVRIFNGEKPADMPIEYQREFEISVNQKTLETLGLELPADLV